MKLALILVLVAVASATPAPQERVYFPEEERADRANYILMPDEEGNVHLQDLTLTDTYNTVASDVTFYLYTRSNPTNAFLIPATNQAAVVGSPFNRNRKNVFVAHGWNGNFRAGVNTRVTAAVLAVEDANVFVVDWSGPANRNYVSARSAVPSAGRIVGQFVRYLTNNYGLGSGSFKLVGFSLGAHLVGCAGAEVNGRVSAIVGLDPAGPLYTIGNRDNRIDETDGEVVQIIHTNGGLLGFGSSIGDADFFPNGGRSQPGCGIDIAGSCAHSRAYEYYAESIQSSGFLALNCNSHSAFNNGQCRTNPRSNLGELFVDRRNPGDFFLNTNNRAPYALGSV